MSVSRPEHPRPQFVRSDWLNLNGTWQFEIDAGNSGLERGLLSRALSSTIQVPFCPESRLSGVGNTDFLNAVWYRRSVTVPAAWKGGRVLLHFEAADYDTTVWIGQTHVGRHRGGFTPFTLDITDVAAPGQEVALTVRCRDDHRLPKPRGKQSERHDRYSLSLRPHHRNLADRMAGGGGHLVSRDAADHCGPGAVGVSRRAAGGQGIRCPACHSRRASGRPRGGGSRRGSGGSRLHLGSGPQRTGGPKTALAAVRPASSTDCS